MVFMLIEKKGFGYFGQENQQLLLLENNPNEIYDSIFYNTLPKKWWGEKIVWN